MNPRIVRTVNGWMALGDGWGVVGVDRDDVERRFREAESRHVEIDQRPLPTAQETEPLHKKGG